MRNNVAVANLETGIAFVGSVPRRRRPARRQLPALAGRCVRWMDRQQHTNDNRADGILTGGGGNYLRRRQPRRQQRLVRHRVQQSRRVGSGAAAERRRRQQHADANGAQQFAFAGTGILSAENNGTIDLIQGNKLSRNSPYGIGIFLDAKAGRIVNNTVSDSSNSGILVSVRAAAAEISSNVVTESGIGGIFVDNHSAVATIADNHVTNSNRGLSVLDHSNVATVLRNTFDDNATVGVDVGISSHVGLIQGLNARNNGAGAPSGGAGFQVRDGSAVGELRDGTISNNSSEGGIFVSSGSLLTLANTTLDGNLYQGIFAFGAGSRVTMSTGSIPNTRRDGAGQGGYAVNAQEGAAIVCAGVTLAGNAGGNVFTASGGTASGCN